MNVLTLNPGSSSLRFQVVDAGASLGDTRRQGGGSIAEIGPNASVRTRSPGEEPRIAAVEALDHAAALERAFEWVAARGLHHDAVGVRLVHVGSMASEARIVDEAYLRELRTRAELAPLHTATALDLIERVLGRVASRVPVAAVSDSAFHDTLPPMARVLPLPRAWTSAGGLQRFGYHGIAVRSVVERFAAHRPEARRLVVVHLGGGCSVTAVRDGRSIDTSMGFSPLEGMVMATRSGSLDPALVACLCRTLDADIDVVARRLSREGGLAGLSGRGGDMREIEALRARGDEAAGLAFDVFARSARAHLAAAQAALGGADAVLLSGGMGENSAAVRAALLADAGWCGIALDPERNAAPVGPLARISQDGSEVAVHVVGVDEESVIARATAALLESGER